MNHYARLKALERSLDAGHFDSFVVTHLPNVHYLCGFTGSSAVLAFAAGDWAFFTDGRYTEQAKQQVRGASVHVSPGATLTEAARWVATKFKRSKMRVRIGVEAEHLTLALQQRLANSLAEQLPRSRFRLVPTSDLVERLRVKKDADEIRVMREAARLASGIFPDVLRQLGSEATENEIAAELEYLARKAGAERMSFETIVAAGQHSALPHARPTMQRIGRGFVVLDYGVILHGYCSDMTRTVFAGRADAAARKLYGAVLDAQLAGIAAVRPGRPVGEVDAVARAVLKKRKLDKYFTHSLGHGVGLEIHETPRLAKGQTQVLEPGMVITIEPGAYVAGRGGVRIEDLVLVTDAGCEILSATPKEFMSC